MLEKVLKHLHNWFVVPNGVYLDCFTVQDGTVMLPFLQKGQYFRVVGSVFNDGLYQYPAANLLDETFHGAVWALAVPKRVVELSEQIAEWDERHGGNTPYTSESFSDYSYTKATDSKGQPLTWEKAFRKELNEWRRPQCLF